MSLIHPIDPFYFKNKYRIKSARMEGFDYSQPGLYYITICVKDMKCCLGKVRNEKVILSEMGKIIKNEWLKTEIMRSNIFLDAYIIMPNHLHGIIEIRKNVETHGNASLQYKNIFGPQKNNLSSIIRGFKSTTTKQINEKLGNKYFQWQPRFYDHVVRDQDDLNRIREYIKFNPIKWEIDRNNRNIAK